MLNLHLAQIESLSVHRVGNKSRNEALFISEDAYNVNDQLHALLKEYFLKPFRDIEENYFHFVHETDLEFHDLYQAVNTVFNNPLTIHEQSKEIVKQLYEQSVHPHIKPGEVFVVYFDNLIMDNQQVQGVGIFKSEIKHDFLQFEDGASNLKILLEEGVNLSKLDKGALIFNTNKDDGYKVMSVDSNKYDTKYWLEDFLGIDVLPDENFNTKAYLKFCQNFAKDVVFPAEDKQQEVLFMNRTVNHFAQNDNFEEGKFLNEVIENPDLIPEFHNYKADKAPKFRIEDLTEFPVSNTAVSTARKKMKNVISLDTNVQIKLDFINPESAEKFIEKGWDPEREMYYYLVYFNKEEKS